MKRTALLHAELSAVIAALGHGDQLVLGDAGLPVPRGVRRIDLAVTAQVPRLADVLAAVLSEMQVESAILADELSTRSPAMHEEMGRLLGAVPVTRVPHEAFKSACAHAVAVVRTGEFTPYANVILRAGVTF